MKTILKVLLCLLLSAQAHAAVLNNVRVVSGFGSSPQSAAFGFTSTAGSAILLCITTNAAGPSGVSVSGYTEIYLPGTGGQDPDAVWLLRESAPATSTVSVAWTNGASLAFVSVFEVTGLAASPFSVGVMGTGYSGVAQATGTASEASMVFVGQIKLDDPETISSVIGGVTANPGTGSEERRSLYNTDLGASGSKTVGLNIAASHTWAVHGVFLKASGGGSSSPLLKILQQAALMPANDPDYSIPPMLARSR